MADKLLKIAQVAERLGTTSGVARSILENNGLNAVDLGKGRSRGLRWSEQAVNGLVDYLVEAAQGKRLRKVQSAAPYKSTDSPNLASIDINSLYTLTLSRA